MPSRLENLHTYKMVLNICTIHDDSHLLQWVPHSTSYALRTSPRISKYTKTDVPARSPLFRHLQLLRRRLITSTQKLTSLGIDNYFSERFSYPSWMILLFPSSDTTCRKKALEEMEKIWKISSGGSLLLISWVYKTAFIIYSWWLCRLSVAVLQIDAVGTTLWGKTLAITTFTLALATLLSSVIVLVDRNSLLQASVLLRWQEVRSTFSLSALTNVRGLFIGI